MPRSYGSCEGLEELNEAKSDSMDRTSPSTSPDRRSFEDSLSHFVHSKTGQTANLVFLVFVIALTTALCAMELHDPELCTRAWYYALEATLDLSVLLEFVIRWVYRGRLFWKSIVTWCDALVIGLCVAATITEHIPSLQDDQVEDVVAMGCRIVRDVLRILRLILLMRWLSKSVVELCEAPTERQTKSTCQHETVLSNGLFDDQPHNWDHGAGADPGPFQPAAYFPLNRVEQHNLHITPA